MRLRISLVMLAILAAYACDSVVDPPLDDRAVRFTPPSVYRTWWNIVQSCSLKNESFDDVTWYQVPNTDFVRLRGKNVGAYWAPVSNSIVLAGNGLMQGDFVRHEMLHAVLRKGGHPYADFIQRCGGAVTCAGDCVTEAGAGPNPDTVSLKLPADSLVLSVSTQPQPPSETVDDGYFTIVISAKNPRTVPVAVILDLTNPGFSYNLFGPQGSFGESESVVDRGRSVFAAGETRVKYFDLRIGPFTQAVQHAVVAGSYTIIGGFSGKRITLTGVRIGL
jgi:hypothetical protein